MTVPTQADRRRAEAITDHAVWLGADPATAREAGRQVATDRSLALLAVNGWLASGKDSVAPAVLHQLGIARAEHLFYAKMLKAELDLIIAATAVADTPERATADVAGAFDIPTPQARHLVALLWEPTRQPTPPTAYHRSDAIRLALQFHGTDVRRAQDPDYWVKLTLAPVVNELAAGRSVFATDVRFENEVTGSQKLGFFVVRLDITRETQRQRLLERDGLEPNVAALQHSSETALDDFDGFDLRVDNNGPIQPTVDAIAALFR